MGGTATESGTLAALIERLSAGTDTLDERFARGLARQLHEAASRISLPEVDALGLEDVIATFYMDRRLRLVVTGNLVASGGAVQVSWDERDFPLVEVMLHESARESAYTFATLDFSCRGRKATLLASAGRLPAGLEVTLRARATIGAVEEYRVTAHGMEASVPPADLVLAG